MAVRDDPVLRLEMPIILRIADESDLPKLEWFGKYTHFRNVFRKTYEDQLAGLRLMLLADCNRFPIGHVFVQLSSGDFHLLDGRRRSYLYSLRVMDMFQGRGIGSWLVRHVERILYEQGFGWSSIAASKDNPRARQLYERLGYRVFMEDPGEWSYPDHEGVIHHVEEPCWVLEKKLSLQ